MKYTQGNWEIIKRTKCLPIYANGKLLLTVWNGTTDKSKANAKLIAAAPEILKSLEDLIEDCRDIIREYCMQDQKPEIYNSLCKHLEKAKTAYNKATL